MEKGLGQTDDFGQFKRGKDERTGRMRGSGLGGRLANLGMNLRRKGGSKG